MNRLPFTQILSLVCLLPLFIWAKEIKINKVLDRNPFELKNGQKIKLAKVESPSTRYSFNILAGAGDRPGFSDSYYREIHFSYEPIKYKRGVSLAFGLIQTDAPGDPEAPSDYPESKIRTFYLPYLIPQFRVQGNYIGLNGGLFF